MLWGCSLLVLASVLSFQYFENAFVSILCGIILGYLPSYFDGSEYTGERYWHWYSTKVRGKVGTLKTHMEMEKDKQYIYCSHPHGLMSMHHGACLLGTLEPTLESVIQGKYRRHLGASVVFWIPIYRDILLWTGVVSANKVVAKKMLEEEKALFILVGGIAEQMLCAKQEQKIYIRHRKGFVKLALEFGVGIVPGYNFGETELYYTSRFLLEWRQWIAKKWGVALILGYGRCWYMPWLPRKVQLHQVFGKPIQVPKIVNPSDEDIDKYHQLYIQGIVDIYEQHKVEYGFEYQQLNIV